MRGKRQASLLLACALLLARPAHADDAIEWKLRGDDAMTAGRAAEALDAYRRAATIEPSPTLDYNIGRALLAVGDLVGALEAFERYQATAPEALRQKTYRLEEIMTDVRSKLATLHVEARQEGVDGAEVFVRGKLVGTLPLAPMRANPGHAEVRVARTGYEPFVERFELGSGATTRVDVSLRPERIVARLSVVTTPPGARLSVDGTPRGQAPLAVDLTPGAHRLSLSLSGHQPRTLEVSLAERESRQVDVELAPERAPLTSRWWFWAGIGVVSAALTATVVALNVERSPSQGSLGTFSVP